jgi:hypothetical protein
VPRKPIEDGLNDSVNFLAFFNNEYIARRIGICPSWTADLQILEAHDSASEARRKTQRSELVFFLHELVWILTEGNA